MDINFQQTVRVINKSKNPLPMYATPGSSGLDICTNIGDYTEKQLLTVPSSNVDIDIDPTTDKPFVAIYPGGRFIFPTGLYVSIPKGFEIQVRPRSGLAAKKGITILNAPGTIDSDYRGDIGVILYNASNEDVIIHDGDKIAQLVLCPINQIVWDECTSLDDTERGAGGYGHSDDKSSTKSV